MDKKSENMKIALLLKRFTYERLPKALHLKEKVFAGEKLNDFEIAFLDTIFKDAQDIMQRAEKNAEYQEIVSKAVQLYSDITQKALENEKKDKKGKSKNI